MAGVISTYKTRTTRNNTLMAYVNLEDDTASMELLYFSRVLNESGGYIRERTAPSWSQERSPCGREGAPAGGHHPSHGELDGKERPAYQRLYLRLPAGRTRG